MKRISLGFDLRVRPSFHEKTSSHIEQRLVPGISNPMSADPSVWPQSAEVASLWNELRSEFTNPLHLARSLDLLRESSSKLGVAASALVPVSLTTLQTNIIALIKRFGTGFFEDQPDEETLVSLGWQLRGFDVVDLQGLISGLKGCGYAGPSRALLHSHFAASLNDMGLFNEWSSASMFAEFRGLEIREHAPFIVVGLLTHDLVNYV